MSESVITIKKLIKEAEGEIKATGEKRTKLLKENDVKIEASTNKMYELVYLKKKHMLA